MKKYCTIISLALFFGLFVYLVFRSQHTIVNILLNKLTNGNAMPIICDIRQHFLLPKFMIYSLPEGLWALAATLVSKRLFLRTKRGSLHLAWVPLIYCISLEILQLFGWMPGSFDFMDILFPLVLTIYGIYFIKCPLPIQYLLQRFNYRTFFFVYIYAIVFLSHVSI